MKLIRFIALMALGVLTACSHNSYQSEEFSSFGEYSGAYKLGNPYHVEGVTFTPKYEPSYDKTGYASWYGPSFHGRSTASGASFNAKTLTAAHPTLPLPSVVRVTNLENGRTLVVMVNDRGPFTKGRILDVSKRAAQLLGFEQKGVAKVRVQYLKGQTDQLLDELNLKRAAGTPRFKSAAVSKAMTLASKDN